MDALLLLMGGDVEVVSEFSTHSRAAREFAAYVYPTTSVPVLRFRDGRVGKYASVIDCQQPYYFRVHLIGSEGTLLDDKFFSTALGALNPDPWSRLGVPLPRLRTTWRIIRTGRSSRPSSCRDTGARWREPARPRRTDA